MSYSCATSSLRGLRQLIPLLQGEQKASLLQASEQGTVDACRLGQLTLAQAPGLAACGNGFGKQLPAKTLHAVQPLFGP